MKEADASHFLQPSSFTFILGSQRETTMFLRTIRVRKHERGLWFRHGDFRRLLEPGVHRFAGPLPFPGRDRFTVVNTLSTRFEHPLLDTILVHPHVRDALHVVDLTDVERALVWKDERLAYVLGPGRHAFWKEPYRLFVETFHVHRGTSGCGFRFEHPRLAVVLQHPDASRWLDTVQASAGEQVLLYRDGVLVDRLAEGLHVYWKGTGKVAWKAVDLRERVADVAGQEVITADGVTLRVNLLVTWQVTDPAKAVSTVGDYARWLYREAQLALRAAAGTRPLEALLEKESAAADVRKALAKRTAEFGVAVRSVGLRDVILPGELKTLLNQAVAAARKAAEANLIRRRAETASARSRADAAGLRAEGPHVARREESVLLRDDPGGAAPTFDFGDDDPRGERRSLSASDETRR